MWPLIDPRAGPVQSEAPHPPPLSLKCTSCPLFPQWEPFSRTYIWKNSVLRPPGLHTCLKRPVRASLQTFTILAGAGGVPLPLWPPKTSFLCKCPCMLSLPPTNLKQPASFFCLSALLVVRGAVSDFPQEASKFVNQHLRNDLTFPIKKATTNTGRRLQMGNICTFWLLTPRTGHLFQINKIRCLKLFIHLLWILAERKISWIT